MMKNQTGSGRRGGSRRTKPTLKRGSGKPGNSNKLGKKAHKPSYTKRRKPEPKRAPLADSNAPMRLNRYVAQAGICSRREADVLIQAGVVSVNGKVVTEMGYRVGPTDKVQVEGDTIKAETKRYILINKPKNILATDDDPRGRRTVMSLIHGACKERVFPVGRLDRDTSGLLLLTNDGEMTKRLTHPRVHVRNLYHVSTSDKVKKEDLLAMLEGFELEGKFIKLDKASFVKDDPRQIGVEIHSGRNRIVRRIFEHFGYKVAKLDRVIYSCLNKKDLPRGAWRHLTEQELSILRMTT